MTINIVSFDVPYPADYGGVIDVFYKLKSLHALGVKVILHTFEYGRGYAEDLKKYCDKVYYYKRNTGIKAQFTTLPYIVKSRGNENLLKELCANDHPIIFEGLHTCYYLNHPKLQNRLKIVRTHNIEHQYYDALSKTTKKLHEKLFFTVEKKRLHDYENILKYCDFILPLSNLEEDYFVEKYGLDKVKYVPIFHPNEKVFAIEHIEKPYLLFHGNLSVAENEDAANYLIKHIAQKDTSLQLIIAGKNPSLELERKAKKLENVLIVSSPSFEEMNQLIKNASINILYAKQAAGVKLKLLNSLYLGRYCLANSAIVSGSGLEDLCVRLPENEQELLKKTHELYIKDFDLEEKKKRQIQLDALYNNHTNADKVIKLIKSYLSTKA